MAFIRELGLLTRSPALFFEGEPCTYFTTEPTPEMGHGLSVWKTEYRLEVESYDLHDVRFFHWIPYAREHGLHSSIIDVAAMTGGGGEAAETWWIALDPIPFEALKVARAPTYYDDTER